MASSASGLDEPNRVLWLATRAGKMESSCPLGTTRCIPQACHWTNISSRFGGGGIVGKLAPVFGATGSLAQVHIHLCYIPKKRRCFYLYSSFHYFASFFLGKQKVSQCGSTNEGVWRQKIWSMEGTGWSQSPDIPQEESADQTISKLCHYTQECRWWRC